MNEADLRLIVERYTKRFQQFGVDIRTLASGNTERREIRFRNFAGIGDLNGCSILDIGCGFADFYQYLKIAGLSVDYHGIDICPPFIDVCRERFPKAHFKVADFQSFKMDRRYDYIVASQAFNNKFAQEDNLVVMKDVIRKAYEHCNVGVAIDMITSYVDYKESTLYYYSPEEIFTCAKALTKRVILKHDYPLFEFMILLYRDFAGWRKP